MTKPKPPYDPVAYKAELDAKCQRVGARWLPSRAKSNQRLPEGSKGDEIRDARLRMKLLEDPELAERIRPEHMPEEGG